MVIIAACSLLVYLFSIKLRLLGSKPKNVDLDFNYNETLKFPAVTICNESPYKWVVASNWHFEKLNFTFRTISQCPLFEDTRYDIVPLPCREWFASRCFLIYWCKRSRCKSKITMYELRKHYIVVKQICMCGSLTASGALIKTKKQKISTASLVDDWILRERLPGLKHITANALLNSF